MNFYDLMDKICLKTAKYLVKYVLNLIKLVISIKRKTNNWASQDAGVYALMKLDYIPRIQQLYKELSK